MVTQHWTRVYVNWYQNPIPSLEYGSNFDFSINQAFLAEISNADLSRVIMLKEKLREVSDINAYRKERHIERRTLRGAQYEFQRLENFLIKWWPEGRRVCLSILVFLFR